MNNYFASVEINFDAKDRQDAYYKLSIINNLIEAYLDIDCGFVRDGQFEPQDEEDDE